LRSRVLGAYRPLLILRRKHKAFHPNGSQQVLDLDPAVFALLRTSPDGNERIVALHNVANAPVTVSLKKVPLDSVGRYTDLIANRPMQADAELRLDPYQVAWLKA
jgi:glycosidase